MHKFLRKAIEVKFGKAIQFQKDILDLKDDVYYITSSSLGFNTLRRCFGFLPSVNTILDGLYEPSDSNIGAKPNICLNITFVF